MTYASVPRSTKCWTVESQNGFDGLKFHAQAPLPELSGNDVLVKLHAASLNYRDVIIPKGFYTFAVKPHAVPGSAKASGAIVIATTSSAEKGKVLRSLGADHVINYKTTLDWAAQAKKFTQEAGVDHIVEVGGPATMKQSLDVIKIVLMNTCIVRGTTLGNRVQFEDMNRAIEANKIKPWIDQETFKLEELKEAYQYLWDRQHVGKVAVKIE